MRETDSGAMNCASAIAMVAPVTIKMLRSYMAGSDDVSRSSYRFQQGLSAQRLLIGEHGGQARLRHISRARFAVSVRGLVGRAIDIGCTRRWGGPPVYWSRNSPAGERIDPPTSENSEATPVEILASSLLTPSSENAQPEVERDWTRPHKRLSLPRSLSSKLWGKSRSR
jgi:hypothetical protein